MPPCSSLSVGSRFSPPTVVAVKSPMAWMELMANSSPTAMQLGASKAMPKCSTRGRENQAAWPTSAKLTIPKHRATMYPNAMPSRMDASLQMPLPRLFSTMTAVRVRAATSQFCQEP